MNKELLDRDYINRIRYGLDGFEWKSDTVANCRCPMCGDSQRRKRIKRGFFTCKDTDKGFKFTCHNCQQNMYFEKFLKQNFPQEFATYRLDKIRYASGGSKMQIREKETPPVPVVSVPVVAAAPQPTPVADPLSTIKSVMSLPTDHDCWKYVEGRKIPERFAKDLFYSKDFGCFVKRMTGADVDIHDERLIIPLRTADGKLFGFQGRSLIPDSPIRYLTIKTDKDHPKVWGLDKVDRERTIWAMEGPIKAMFVSNSIGMVGNAMGDLSKYIPADKMVYVFDNEPRNPELVAIIETHVLKNLPIVIWNNCPWSGKDVNDMIVDDGASESELVEYMTANTYRGLKAKVMFGKWRKV